MGKQSAPPPAPNFKAAAEETARAGQQAVQTQTQANRPGISTPYAQQQWTQGPDGQWQMNTGFTGGLGLAATSLQQQAGQNLSNPFSFGQFGAVQTGDQARDQAINAAYGQATSRLDPQWNQREQQMRAQLANQGLDMNSQAAMNAMGQFNLGRNDAYSSAMNSAIGQGTAAGSAVFGQNMAARQQSISEALRQRSMPLETLQSMQGLLAMPGFQGAGLAQTPNYMGAAQQQGSADYQKWAAQQQQQAELTKGIMSTIGAVGGSFFGPAGTMVGGALGTGLGSLFGGGTPAADPYAMSAPIPLTF